MTSSPPEDDAQSGSIDSADEIRADDWGYRRHIVFFTLSNAHDCRELMCHYNVTRRIGGAYIP